MNVTVISASHRENSQSERVSKIISSPGMLKRHYSPGIPMKLNQTKAKSDEAFIVFRDSEKQVWHNQF